MVSAAELDQMQFFCPEPSLGALNLRSEVIASIKILSPFPFLMHEVFYAAELDGGDF